MPFHTVDRWTVRALCGPYVGAALTVALALGGFAAIAIAVAASAGPVLEAMYFPVLTDERATDVSIVGGRLCFTYSAVKRREAQLVSSQWTVRYGAGQFDDVRLRLNGEPAPRASLPKGPFVFGPLCGTLPLIDGKPVSNADILSVRFYKTHALYDVVQSNVLLHIP